MKVPATKEGIEYLNKLITDLTSKSENFGSICEKLSKSVAGRAEGLHGFEPQIQEVVTEIRSDVNNAAEGIREVTAGLQTVISHLEVVMQRLGRA